MASHSATVREPTAAECLAALRLLREDPRCRCCVCLDWALAQLQLGADSVSGAAAAALRVAPAAVQAAPDCRPCPPLDAVLAWLQAGRHSAEV
jgi:hypothetical protein